MTVRERASEGEMVPGTSLVMHRFRGDGPDTLRGVPWINASGLPADTVTPYASEIAAALSMWVEDQKLTARGGSGGTMFDRNAYVPPDNIFDLMGMAKRAVQNDDIVGGLADTTEGMAIDEVHWESDDLDETDMMNQWAQLVHLDNFIRASWREGYTFSQYVCAAWWGFHDFQIRGRSAPSIDMPEDAPIEDITRQDGVVDPNRRPKVKLGNRRKRKITLYCPVALTHLDSRKVVPIGTMMFTGGNLVSERLAWCATREEVDTFKKSMDPEDPTSDAMMTRLFIGQYIPTDAERVKLQGLGVNVEYLLEFNPRMVWRWTMTRPDYEPWADVRLKRVFRWLDMKQQQLAADRVALIGNANYILLVTKGDKDNMPDERDLSALNEQFQYIARLPVVIGDYTLNIEIIQPKMDFTLNEERYQTINMHILHTILRTFRLEGKGSSRGDTTLTVGRAIARGLDSVRRMIRRDFEAHIASAIWDHAFNQDVLEGSVPNLAFSPRNINLDVDLQSMQALIAARTSGDLSRRTFLEELGQDQDVEAIRRLQEQEYYDLIFKTTTTPGSPNNPFTPGADQPGDGGPANNGGGDKPPGAGGGGGRPPGGINPTKRTSPAKKATAATRAARAPRGKNR